MCGRFTLTVDISTLLQYFQVNAENFTHAPKYNIAPGQQIPVIVKVSNGRKICMMRWGLIPHWVKDTTRKNYKMINARAETIAQKPAFRESFRRRRCLIPADGFYEWKKHNNGKYPVRIVIPGQEVFAFAGIWDQWISPDDKVITSCSLITTSANNYMKRIHDRMPVILSNNKEYATWLNVNNAVVLKELLQPYRGEMVAYQVSSIVNSPKNDQPQCINEVREIKPLF